MIERPVYLDNLIKAKIIDPPSLTIDSPSSEPLLDMAYKPDNH